MVGIALALSLAAAEPFSLALPGLNGVGLAPGEAALYGERLAQKLQGYGLKVISARDIGAALGLERQRELLGCAESGCIAELAGALGTDALILGDVGKLGETYAVNFKVLSKERSLALFNADGAKAGELPRVIDDGARALAHQLAAALSRPELEPPVVVAEPAPAVVPLRKVSWAPISVGALALAFGITGQLVATVKLNAIAGADTVSLAALYRDQGKQWEVAGNVLLAAGAALLVAGLVMYVMGGPR